MGGGSNGRHKDIKEIEREGSDVVCNVSLPSRSGNHGTNTDKQQRLQVCKNSCVRRIAGIKRVDWRRMDELREEIGQMLAEMDWTFGLDGENGKESRLIERARSEENRFAAVEIGGLCEERYQ